MDDPDDTASDEASPAAPSGPWVPVLPGLEVIRMLAQDEQGTDYYAAVMRERGLRVVVAVSDPGRPSFDEALRLAERQARLFGHPAIVPLLRLHEVDGWVVRVLIPFDWQTLRVAIDQGPPAGPAAARIALELTMALAYARGEGLVLDQLSPHAVFLDDRGPRLLSIHFRPLDGEATLTLGLPFGLAPEQWTGATTAITPQVTAYHIGGLLYWIVSGHPPFFSVPRREPEGIVKWGPAPNLTRIAPGVDRALAAIVAKCLEIDPGRRYGDLADLAAALRSYLEAPHRGLLGRLVGRWAAGRRPGGV